MPTSSRTSRRTRRTSINSVMSCVGPAKAAGTATVCGIPYNIVVGEDAGLINEEGEFRQVLGVILPATQDILLDSVLGPDQREATLLHEVVHGIDHALGLGMVEEQVHLLAAGLYSVSFKGPRKRDKARTMRGVFYG